jgi:chromosome segregation ATPase
MDYTTVILSIKDMTKEKNRRIERDQDHLKLDLKDLKIELYKIEKELTEWKDKYYNAIQELITVKAELEDALIRVTHAEHHLDELDTEF